MTDRPDPFSEIEELFEQFSQLGDPLGRAIPIDVVDAGDELVVHADLPGRDSETITVQLEDSRKLHIEVPQDDTTADGRYVSRERTREQVSRTISLPAAVDEAETEASYDRGVLTVRLTKITGDSDGTDIPVN